MNAGASTGNSSASSTVLVSKFGWTEADVQSALRSYLVEATRVTIKGDVSVCRDPKDDMIFECAVRANADIIVSGDKDILTIGEYNGIRVLTARQYIAG